MGPEACTPCGNRMKTMKYGCSSPSACVCVNDDEMVHAANIADGCVCRSGYTADRDRVDACDKCDIGMHVIVDHS